ncbi:MAG: hypothetical protein ABW123_26100 [Cystobacter sp.]
MSKTLRGEWMNSNQPSLERHRQRESAKKKRVSPSGRHRLSTRETC